MARMRKVGQTTTLIGGVALMLVWAGLVEAFFSSTMSRCCPTRSRSLWSG